MTIRHALAGAALILLAGTSAFAQGQVSSTDVKARADALKKARMGAVFD